MSYTDEELVSKNFAIEVHTEPHNCDSCGKIIDKSKGLKIPVLCTDCWHRVNKKSKGVKKWQLSRQ